MRSLKLHTTAAFALLTLFSLLPATPAKAQAYLHSLSDLRAARWYLQRNVAPDRANAQAYAVNEITKAIDEVKKAAEHDGRNLADTPPPQSGGNEEAPIHSAVRLLKEARHDIDQGQDIWQNTGLRVRSLDHIDKALQALAPYL